VPTWSAAGRLVCFGREAPLTRTIERRLERLESRAKEVAAAEPHTLCYVDRDKRVVSTFEMATGKWTHFDPPRDHAEFEQPVRNYLPITPHNAVFSGRFDR
jgi:hypothetical protein